MWIIDEIFWLLRDGRWHDLREVAEKCSLNVSKVETIMGHLSRCDLVRLGEEQRRAKLSPLMREFISEIQLIGKEEVVKS